MRPNYAINPTPELYLRSNRALLPARVIAALGPKGKCMAVLLIVPVMVLGQFYTDLQSRYGVDLPIELPDITNTALTITGPAHEGLEKYWEGVSLKVSTHGITIWVESAELKAVAIPTKDIDGCAMTCFGTKDRHLDLLLSEDGAVLSFPTNAKLEEWCWSAKKQIYPGAVQRAWEYSGARLPPYNASDPQFQSKSSYDAQLYQSCLGY